MNHTQSRPLEGVRVLIVEDEYAVAADMTWWLEDSGAEVIGPAPTVEEALSLIQTRGEGLNGAVLDVNLAGEKVFPVADALLALGVGFVFSTGYERAVLPCDYDHVARQTKPLDRSALVDALARAAGPAKR